MGHSVIPAPSDEQRPREVVDEDEAFMEPKPVVLTGQAAIDFAEMVLSPAPDMSPGLRRAAELHRKMVISE